MIFAARSCGVSRSPRRGTTAGRSPIAVATGLVADRLRRGGVVVATFVSRPAPWLLPGLIVVAAGPHAADATAFDANLHGPGGVLALVLGYGFWQLAIAAVDGPWVAMLALAVLTLAVLGARELPGRWRRRARGACRRRGADRLSRRDPGAGEHLRCRRAERPLGGPLAESQRVLPLRLFFLAPAAAHGAKRIGSIAASSALRSAPAAVLAGAPAARLALALGGRRGGSIGRMFPASWYEARDLVDGEGTVLALPWHQYFDLEAADGRRVFNPSPISSTVMHYVVRSRARLEQQGDHRPPRGRGAGPARRAR